MTARRPRRPRRHAGALTAAAVVLSLTGLAACGGGDDDVEVVARDYEFRRLPATVSAGAELSLRNESDKEIHELALYRLSDDESRTAAELFALPEEELMALFSAEPAAVMVAPPGEESFIALGDAVVDQTGRYVVVCAIPTGADPAEFLRQVELAQGGPPQVPGGPPHFVNGMFAEFVVR